MDGEQARSDSLTAVKRALIVGGTGLIGSAVARHLAAAGWQVDVAGRNPARFASDLAATGVSFIRADHRDAAEMRTAVGAGADLLVDCACHTAADAKTLLPVLSGVSFDGDDLQQGCVRRRRRAACELGGIAPVRRPHQRIPTDHGPQ